MIVYLDTSALVKRYVQEAHSDAVNALIGQADLVGSVVLARVEMASVLAKAVRQKWIEPVGAEQAWKDFRAQWPAFVGLAVSPALLNRAERLAWEAGLRGYDAIHLAAALIWQETLEVPVVLATFDQDLWTAAPKAGLTAWPAGG
jgi:uncharacterized protein